MWKLCVVDDQGQKTVVPLVRDEYTIGRADGSTIRLTDRNISRQHAIVIRTKRGFLIEDLQSDNGTSVNGVRVSNHHELAHKDLIQCGDYRIEVIDEDLATQEQSHGLPPSSYAPASGRLPDRLVVLIGPNQGGEYSLESERILLGRGEECDVVLDHSSVSRVHAEVRRVEDGRFEILDKASANGVRINGRDMPRALLDSRDVIELGDVVLKYIPHGQVFRVTPTEGHRIAVWNGEAPPPAKTASSLPAGRSLAAAVVGAALAIAVGYFLTRKAPDSDSVRLGKPDQPLQESPLEHAGSLFSAGDLDGAHAVLQGIPETSPLRQDPAFARIEAAWARAVIDLAQNTESLADRRDALDKVSRTTGVPKALRDEAFGLLKKAEEPTIDLSELGEKPKSGPVPAGKRTPDPHADP